MPRFLDAFVKDAQHETEIMVMCSADKFMQKFGAVINKQQQADILEVVNEVFQMVHGFYVNVKD